MAGELSLATVRLVDGRVVRVLLPVPERFEDMLAKLGTSHGNPGSYKENSEFGGAHAGWLLTGNIEVGLYELPKDASLMIVWAADFAEYDSPRTAY